MTTAQQPYDPARFLALSRVELIDFVRATAARGFAAAADAAGTDVDTLFRDLMRALIWPPAPPCVPNVFPCSRCKARIVMLDREAFAGPRRDEFAARALCYVCAKEPAV